MKRATVSLTPQGGMSDTSANTPAGWALSLLNAFYRLGSWVWRSGATIVNAIEYSDQLAGVWGLKSISSGDSTLTMIAASRGGTEVGQPPAYFLLLTGAGFSGIPYNGVATPPNTDQNWRAWRECIVNPETLYACRRTDNPGGYDGQLFQVTASQVTPASVPAPPTPTVVTSGTAGALPAGTYPVGCRYVTSDGEYSPMSPIPAVTGGGLVTVTAAQKRRWTTTFSQHPRVTGIELMVGFDGGSADNTYFAYLAPNANATVDEDVLDIAYDKTRIGHPGLSVAPNNPEDTGKWDARQWVLTNDPEPLLCPSFIDESGALFSIFDLSEALSPPTTGSSRWMAFRPWDRKRAAVLTDTSCHVLQPSGTSYNFSDVSLQHGCVSAAALDIGAGKLVWFDGRNILASDGGPAEIISKGWIDQALAQCPVAYADRAVVKYSPNDGGGFCISFPSTASSTGNDLMAVWDGTQWHKRNYFGTAYGVAARAVSYLNRVPAADGGGEWLVGILKDSKRVIRLDAPERVDVGVDETSAPILVEIETGQVPLPDGYGTVSVSRVHVGIRRRPDTNTTAPKAAVVGSFSLNLNGLSQTTPVTATLPQGQQYIHARVQNLGAPKSGVSIIMNFNAADILEIFDVRVDCVFYRRDEKTT